MSSTVLVTGGAGYIGSHTSIQLLESGFNVVVLDNLSNSSVISLARIKRITGREVKFVHGDIRNQALLRQLFADFNIDSVIHFAGLKAVGESQTQPALYYSNNVMGSLCLFEEMARAGVFTLVFSSSATVYGDQGSGQYKEDASLLPMSVYGRTKRKVEDMIRDLAAADERWCVVLLRYFNPVGAHTSGLIGEDPNGIPNNLMPFIAQVAVGKRDKLLVFGSDYPTPDGTGLRDYIHVADLASGHLAALRYLIDHAGVLTINLGTGRPTSVLEMVSAFERASGRKVPFDIVQRRSGDVAVCYSDASLAQVSLNWRAELDIHRMCEDTWRWQMCNPNGYSSN